MASYDQSTERLTDAIRKLDILIGTIPERYARDRHGKQLAASLPLDRSDRMDLYTWLMDNPHYARLDAALKEKELALAEGDTPYI